jgi:homoserine/homoserine lactone efflux protein
MNAHLFLAFCLAATALVLLPGPIVTLVIANSLSHGTRSGLTTVAGASLGNALLLTATAVGLIAFFAFLSELFEVVRWVGAAYLIVLGIKGWRASGGDFSTLMKPAPRRSGKAVFLQGFLIAITNPKAIVFYVAFLPQFIDPHRPAGLQLLAMCTFMIVVAVLSDSSYALLAGRARRWFGTPWRRRMQERVSGTLLIGVGCGLLLTRRGG